MAKLMNLISAIDQSSHQYDEFILNLLSTNSDLPFNTDEVDKLLNSIISTINNRLNQTITRHDGLNILLHILPKCSKELLSKYGAFWISKTMQVLESIQSERRQITLACQVLANLITSCKGIPELQKQISMQTGKQVVTVITNMECSKRCGAVYYLIATFLFHYKESAEKLQISLRKLIQPTIDAKQKNLVQAGANCFALLARATERTFKPPSVRPNYTSWVYSQSLICNSLHVIMDELFSDFMEMETVDVWAKLELPRILETDLFDYYSRLERRFENLSIFLSTMLRGCAGRNSVCPTEILKVLCRGLAITPVILQMDAFKHQMLGFILPKLHMNLLTILNALIDGFRQELLPHANTILKLYAQTLKWTGNIQHDTHTISGSKPYDSVRKAVYRSLSLWLTRLSNLSAIEIAADDMIPYILREITPEKNRVLLTVEKPDNLSKRALKRFKDGQYENSAVLGGAASHVQNDRQVNADVCKEVLVTLESLIYNSASFIKLPLYKNVQRLIVSLLYDVYLGTDETSCYKHDYSCRHSLLKVLRAIQMNPHPSLSPPTQYSIEIFSLAMNDAEICIINEAKLSLIEIEKIVHPCAPTLQLPTLNKEHKSNDVQSQLESIADVSPTDNSRKPNGQITHMQEDDLAEQEADEPIEIIDDEIIDDENIDGLKPSKQRKLNKSEGRGETSDEYEDSCADMPQVIENSIVNSQANEIAVSLPSEQPVPQDNCQNSESSVKNISQSVSVENGNKESNNPVWEDDSGDEAILGLFCDKLKEGQ